MTVHDHRELERKYDVGIGCVVPDLGGLPPIEAVAAPSELDQVATYYDTPRLSLLGAGVTLRRRTGGVDDGWHLKLPTRGEARVETQVPLTDDEAGPPRALVDRVRFVVRDETLAPVARLRTQRRVHRLLDKDGRLVAELCDDRVTAQTGVGGLLVERWREWELELAYAPDSLLEVAEPLLLQAGATRAPAGSKLARALARSLPPVRAWRSRVRLADDPTAGDLLLAYLCRQLLMLEEQDRLLRMGDQEAVHQLRVACRRMRSALATYGPVLVAGSTKQLRAELQWLGQTLGEARDAQVQLERFGATAVGEPAGLASPPVPPRVIDALDKRYRRGRRHAERALGSARYFRLLGDLEAWLDDPPLVPSGRLPAGEVVPGLVRRDLDRLRARHARYERASKPRARGKRLHDVRKAAKRLRYAAETAQPVWGERAEALTTQAEAVQDVLGDHQDSVVGRAILRQFGGRGRHHGSTDRGLALLRAHEKARAALLVARYATTVEPLLEGEPRDWP